MKKIIAATLALGLLFATAGCNAQPKQDGSKSAIESTESKIEVVEGKEISIKLKTFAENGIDAVDIERSGIYSGDLVEGIPSGKGTFEAKNPEGYTWTYTGDFENGTFNGQGESVWIDYTETGTFTDGLFTPSKSEFFAHASYGGFAKYTLTSSSRAFLEENPNFFPATSEDSLTAMKASVDTSITYPMLTKSIQNYGSNLIHLDKVQVLQIFENGLVGHTLTTALLWDEDYNYYQLVYDGALPDVLSEDMITVYGLPLATSGFDNVSGGVTNVVVLAGAHVEKI